MELSFAPPSAHGAAQSWELVGHCGVGVGGAFRWALWWGVLGRVWDVPAPGVCSLLAAEIRVPAVLGGLR